MLRNARTAVVGLFLVMLGGCTAEHPSQHLLGDYHQRLANVLDLETIDSPSPGETSRQLLRADLPRRSERQQALTDFRISAWEYLQTYTCALNLLVSERNSSLGKVMPATRRLVYEVSLIEELERCITQLEQDSASNESLLGELRSILNLKRPELDRALWNALFAGPEFEKFASLAVSPFAPEETEPLTIAGQALDQLYQLSTGIQQMQQQRQHAANISAEQFETPLHQLATQQSLGRLQHSLALVIAELQRSTTLLESKQANSQLCPQRVPTTKARYLQNVFHSQFIAKIQPYLSMLQRDGLELLRGLERLIQQHQPEPGNALLIYFAEINQLMHSDRDNLNFRSSVKEHVEAWQTVLARCGLAPARP